MSLFIIWLMFQGSSYGLIVSSDYVKTNTPNKVTAESIANDRGFILPVPEIVDQIHKSATCRVPPSVRHWTYNVSSHNDEINQEILNNCVNKGLISGHKKDIVLSVRGDRVAIYGWHRLNGVPIQPYSTVHGSTYYDYSHGIRLVYPLATVDGEIVDLRDTKLYKKYRSR